MATQKKIETQQVDLCEIIPILLNIGIGGVYYDANDIVKFLCKKGIKYTDEELNAALLKLVRQGTLDFIVCDGLDAHKVLFLLS